MADRRRVRLIVASLGLMLALTSSPAQAKVPKVTCLGYRAGSVSSPYGTTRIGGSQAWAGDVNGDGQQDLAMGTSTTTRSGASGDREVGLIAFGPYRHGRRMSSTAFRGIRIDGLTVDRTAQASGPAVSGIGDFNGDGLDDVAFGDYIVLGRRHAAHLTAGPQSPGVIEISGRASQQAGTQIRPAGDLNDDGLADVVVLPEGTILFGRRQSGPVDRNDPLAGLPITGGAWDALGPGDLNGDGHDDLVVAQNTKVFVIPGPIATDVDPAASGKQLALNGPTTELRVEPGGDLDGDGQPDVIIHGRDAPFPTSADRQQAWALYGSPTLDRLGVIRGIPEARGLATEVVGVGDLNGDGLGELTVGNGVWHRLFIVAGRPAHVDITVTAGHPTVLTSKGHFNPFVARPGPAIASQPRQLALASEVSGTVKLLSRPLMLGPEPRRLAALRCAG